MPHVTMEIIAPYDRQGNDVIINIKKSISDVGMPSKTESFYLRLKDHANAPDDQIRELAMEKIWRHLENMPREVT